MNPKKKATIDRLALKAFGGQVLAGGSSGLEPAAAKVPDVLAALSDAYDAGARTGAARLGRKGGSSTSEAKAEAVRLNGKKGGRPRKVKP